MSYVPEPTTARAEAEQAVPSPADLFVSGDDMVDELADAFDVSPEVRAAWKAQFDD